MCGLFCAVQLTQVCLRFGQFSPKATHESHGVRLRFQVSPQLHLQSSPSPTLLSRWPLLSKSGRKRVAATQY